VDQTLTQQARTSLASVLSTEPRLPKTVTLELTKQQAETVYVALQLGRLQFSLRSIEENPSTAADHAEHRDLGRRCLAGFEADSSRAFARPCKLS
jgi:Flp pilus assembly protein CpaB